ncbi:MAG: hypothetical protein ACYC7C_05180 [Coriobacteriia bacterium]
MDHNCEVFYDLRFEGWQYTDDEIESLREDFEPLGLVHTSGRGGPAALPAAGVEAVVTFVGQTILGVILEKSLEHAYRQLRDRWRVYRARRLAKGLEEPEFNHLEFRGTDLTLEVNGFIDLDGDTILNVVLLLLERRMNGQLKDIPISKVVIPCHHEGGEWRAVEPQEYAQTGDPYVWYISPPTMMSLYGFYDARADRWLEHS